MVLCSASSKGVLIVQTEQSLGRPPVPKGIFGLSDEQGPRQRTIGVASRMVCPCCNAVVEFSRVGFSLPFTCQTCNERLQISKLYVINTSIAAAVLSAIVPLNFRLSWVYVCVVALLLYFPCLIAIAILAKIKFPPKLQRCKPGDLTLFQK